jgi:hypothetical protein
MQRISTPRSDSSSTHLAAAESLFQELGASVHVTPVMNAEDLQRGSKEAGV